jgi:hypothetical protein
MRPHISGTECMGFLKQDGRGNLVVDSLPVIFPLSAFRQRFPVQTSRGLNANHTFPPHLNPQTDTFLRDISLAKLCSTARVWNPQHQKLHHVPYYIDILLNHLGMFILGIISTVFTLRSYFINLE